ncbi:MAG TPA: GGDEF domain-containing protein [Mobilitalea sp.]|nr:GGDEF domain-containing protein [Mobilitalea sp.]
MMKHREKITYYLFYFLIVVEIIIVAFLGFKRHTNVAFQNEPYYSLNTDWNYTDDSGRKHQINLPVELNAGQDNTISINRNLPSGIYHLKTLGILTNHQNISVFLESRLIYSRINNTDTHFFNIPTNDIWDIIDLPPGSEGKKLTITLSSKYPDYAGSVNEIHVGTRSSLLLHNLHDNVLRLILAVITLFLGTIIIIVYLFIKRLLKINRSFLFLGWFAVLCSIWLIMESNLTQLFIENEYVISAFTYLSLMTFPIPIIIYITFIENFHYKKTLYYLAYIFLSSAFLLITLQFFNILDFHESASIVRFEIFVLLGMVLITLLLELFRHKNNEVKVFTISSGILFAFGVVEIFTYQIKSGNTGITFLIGFIIFIAILSWDALRKVADVIKLSETAQHYKFLATKDLLTSCRNRVAYAKDLDRLSLDRNITLLVADMDNMKQINDTYGHHAGDEVIILCSQCLLKVFGRRVYRIGGDEFVIIQYDLDQNKLNTLLQEFDKECAKTNETIAYPFKMSIGYAVYDRNMDKTIYDTVDRADKIMYEKKHKMKDNEGDA